jgi:hypothetical protein
MLMLGERARAECKKRENKIKMRRRLNRGAARVPLKRVKEARKIAKKKVRAGCGARTSEKSEKLAENCARGVWRAYL